MYRAARAWSEALRQAERAAALAFGVASVAEARLRARLAREIKWVGKKQPAVEERLRRLYGPLAVDCKEVRKASRQAGALPSNTPV